MKNQIVNFCWLMIMLVCVAPNQVFGETHLIQVASENRKIELAQCITKKGWVVYSSFTCSACRKQKELFGPAADYLKIIECNPHAHDTQVQQCLKKEIRYTPTWLLENNGIEIKRSKGYKKLDELVAMTGCEQ